MEYFIAIDSGGTKTDTVLFDETGHILCRDLSMGCNAIDIGLETAQKHTLEVIKRVSEKAPERITAVYAGMAGTNYYGREIYDYVRAGMDAKSWRLENDGGNLISGTLGLGDGCCMVCGTGSSLIIRRKGQPWVFLGGRGYLIDTDGSGFRLGQEALKMAFRSVDGRIEKAVLPELIENKVGMPLQQLVSKVYIGGRAYIASFAHLVFEGRKMGDRVCCEIVENGASRMADLTWAGAKYFDGEFSVVMGGGIVSSFPEYARLIQAKASPQAHLMLATAPPVYGGAVEAMADGGRECNQAFRERFISEYAQWKQAQGR